MEIAVSGKFSDDVFDSAESTLTELRALVQRTDLSDLVSELAILVYFPVIISDDLSLSKKSHRSFSKKENAEFANVEINHADWVAAKGADRFRLMLDGLGIAISGSHRISSEAASEMLRRLGVSF